MELPNYCPICGDSTTPASETLGETNTTLFAKDQEFRRVFQCFNKLFEISEPPWLEKAFVFCSECKRQLTVVSELGEVMKEVEKRLKESEKVVKDKLKSSERNFESSGIYRRDKKYWKVRGQFLNRERLSSSVSSDQQPPATEISKTGEPPSQSSNAPNYLHSEDGFLELVKVEVEAPPLENTEIQVENNANILLSIPSTSVLSSPNEENTVLSTNSSSSNQNVDPEESQDEDQRAKRRRVPPKRFDPDEYELNTKSKRAKSDSESNQNENPGTRNVITMFISSGPNGEQQVVKVEEVQVQEYFDEGEELEEASHFEAETNGENDQEQKEHENDDDSDFKIEEEDEQGAKEIENQRGKVSNNKKAFECLLCVRRLPDKKQFDQHIIEFHESNETYKALVDVKATEAATRWMTPGLPEVSYYGITLSKIGDGMEYQCSKCGKVLPNPFRTTKATGLRNHVTEEHTELYKCGHCGQCFCDNKTLKCHERSVHQPPFLYLKE
ncbi:PR domain zinc finger protein 10 [Orchesella cincta]|uniref:PR domain zinc finger protein 10 n=1 Tax=Orchesella cincta TaxID=48709 RepID=A0A1D2M9X6_ORCCI|nr:PR domain zinc finger protein 10 [Orchesella cincta]